MLIGITRVRNEELIIEDTLRHYLGFVDSVILYDDCSTDQTVEIAESFDRVAVIRGSEWLSDRPAEETRHRALLLQTAKQAGAEWCWCFDADERVDRAILQFDADAYSFPLFDGYMTKEHSDPYIDGPLECLPRAWGPERRDIITMFRTEKARFLGRDKREPTVKGRVECGAGLIKHFGKCLSVNHWEETCDYYATHWGEPYRSKWSARRGKAIHEMSDFGTPLFSWAEIRAQHRSC